MALPVHSRCLEVGEAIVVTRREELHMQGCITSRDVLLHAVTICRLWGPGCWLRCLHAVVTGRRGTFLELGGAAP